MLTGRRPGQGRASRWALIFGLGIFTDHDSAVPDVAADKAAQFARKYADSSQTGDLATVCWLDTRHPETRKDKTAANIAREQDDEVQGKAAMMEMKRPPPS